MKKITLLCALMLTISLAQAQTTVTETFTNLKDAFDNTLAGWADEFNPYTSGDTGYEYLLKGNVEDPGRRNEGPSPLPGTIRFRANDGSGFIVDNIIRKITLNQIK